LNILPHLRDLKVFVHKLNQLSFAADTFPHKMRLMTIYIFLILRKIWTHYYLICHFFYSTSWMVNLRARWPDFLQRSFSGETLYILHILQIFCVLFPTSDLTEGTQSRNLFYIFLNCMKTTSINRMQNYCGKFLDAIRTFIPYISLYLLSIF